MPNASAPITEQDRVRFRQLHAEGRSRNAIAAELGRSPSTVTKLARDAGLTFDRAGTAAATAAKQLDNRARRAALEAGLLDDAERIRRQLFAPYVAFAFGGKENDYNEHELPQPDAGAQRQLMGAIKDAVTTSLAIARVDTDAGVDHARSMLGQLFAGLQDVAGVQPEPPAGEPSA